MRLLIVNPIERHIEEIPGAEGEFTRLYSFLGYLRGYLKGVSILVERGGQVDIKLHRVLFGEGSRWGDIERTIRVYDRCAGRYSTGNVLKVPNGRKKPVEDIRLIQEITKGGDILVVGWEAKDTVEPTLGGLLPYRERVRVIKNCVGAKDQEARESFEDFCKIHGFLTVDTSTYVRGVWGENTEGIIS